MGETKEDTSRAKTMQAIKTIPGHKAELQIVPIPALRDDYILVKVESVALNPTDWYSHGSFDDKFLTYNRKHIDIAAPPGTTIGCDFAGVVERAGSKVSKAWKKGDRIAGFTHGGNEVQPEDGCAAEFCVVKDGLCMKIPDHIPNEEACTLGVAITTVGQGLYQSLRLPLPGSNTEANCPVLIYGGSTATGSIAIQYAHLSGCTNIVTTCSDRNVAFVKELGAHTAFDYTDPECAQQIRAYTNDSLAHAFDCISTPVSARICSEAIGSTGGTVSYLLPVKHDRKDVRAEYTLAYTAMGEYFRVLGKDFEALDQDLEFARMFWALSADLVSDGHIRAQPQQIGTAGLNGIFEGWQSMRKGTVSGKKLVYRIEDTE